MLHPRHIEFATWCDAHPLRFQGKCRHYILLMHCFISHALQAAEVVAGVEAEEGAVDVGGHCQKLESQMSTGCCRYTAATFLSNTQLFLQV